MSEKSTPKQPTLTEEQRTAALETQVVTKVSLIAQMSRIIEGCAQRGAFKAEEMEYVGQIYNVLSKTVQDAVEKAKAPKEEEAKNEEETVVVDEKEDVEGELETSEDAPTVETIA